MIAQISSIEEAAEDLARSNWESDPDVLRTYWFHDSKEIRLVHVESTSLPSKKIEPFYFGAETSRGVPFRSAIALVRPEDAENIPLPQSWGAWSDATVWDWKKD